MPYDFFDGCHFFLYGEGGVDPVDIESPALHATEPGHLPLGKLVDGDLEPGEHLVVGSLTYEILRHELVFQSVIYQVISRNTLGEQSLHLVDHSFL